MAISFLRYIAVSAIIFKTFMYMCASECYMYACVHVHLQRPKRPLDPLELQSWVVVICLAQVGAGTKLWPSGKVTNALI